MYTLSGQLILNSVADCCGEFGDGGKEGGLGEWSERVGADTKAAFATRFWNPRNGHNAEPIETEEFRAPGLGVYNVYCMHARRPLLFDIAGADSKGSLAGRWFDIHPLCKFTPYAQMLANDTKTMTAHGGPTSVLKPRVDPQSGEDGIGMTKKKSVLAT